MGRFMVILAGLLVCAGVVGCRWALRRAATQAVPLLEDEWLTQSEWRELLAREPTWKRR